MIIVIILLSGCLAATVFLRASGKLKPETGVLWLAWAALFSLAEGIIFAVVAWLYGADSMSALASASRGTVKSWFLGLGTALISAAIAYMIYERQRRSVRGMLLEWRGHQLVPFFAIKYMVLILVFLCALGIVIEKTMIPYAAWQQENEKINRMNYEKLYKVTTDKTLNPAGYPLWQFGNMDTEMDEVSNKILILGDSFIWGDGYDNYNDLWWKRLQRKLDEQGYNCRIYAVGQCGASTQDQLHWLKDTSMLEDIDPDMIIIGYVTNDAQYADAEGRLVPAQLAEKDYFEERPMSLFKKCFPNITYLLNQKLNNKREQHMVFNEETGFPYQRWELEIINGKYLKRYKEETIEPLGQFLTETDIPSFLVTTCASPDREYVEERYKNVLHYFEGAGISVYNMTDAFLAYAQKDSHDKNLWINPVNGHPGTAATDFFAGYVADILEKDYSQILGDKQSSGIADKKANININDWAPLALEPEKSSDGNTYIIHYPKASAASSFFHIRAGEDYVKLCFEEVADLSGITIKGYYLEGVRIWVTKEDENLGYDTQELYYIGEAEGDSCSFNIENYKKITSLCISADILNGMESNLEVTLE